MQKQTKMIPYAPVLHITQHDVNPYRERPSMAQILPLIRSCAEIANNAIEKARNAN